MDPNDILTLVAGAGGTIAVLGAGAWAWAKSRKKGPDSTDERTSGDGGGTSTALKERPHTPAPPASEHRRGQTRSAHVTTERPAVPTWGDTLTPGRQASAAQTVDTTATTGPMTAAAGASASEAVSREAGVERAEDAAAPASAAHEPEIIRPDSPEAGHEVHEEAATREPDEPHTAESVAAEPVAAEPVTPEPVAAEPVEAEPVTPEPVEVETVADTAPEVPDTPVTSVGTAHVEADNAPGESDTPVTSVGTAHVEAGTQDDVPASSAAEESAVVQPEPEFLAEDENARAEPVTSVGTAHVSSEAAGDATVSETAAVSEVHAEATTVAPEPEATSDATTAVDSPAAPSSVPTDTPEPAADRMMRLRSRLATSGSWGRGLLALLGGGKVDENTWDEVEETLLIADLGPGATDELMENLRTRMQVIGDNDPAAVRELLRDELVKLIDPDLDRRIAATRIDTASGSIPSVILMVGVNGTGKTTTVGKLARVLVAADRHVVLGAADTFRAAAAEQLATWGSRVGVETIRSERDGADPASVAFEAVKTGVDADADVVIVDTAGRLQNKKGLMDQLGKVKRAAEKPLGGESVAEVLLVLDATTGQNGMQQARVFAEAVNITGLVLTKLDGTAKGGIVANVQRELNVPVKMVGLGEGMDDLAPFDPYGFVDALLGD